MLHTMRWTLPVMLAFGLMGQTVWAQPPESGKVVLPKTSDVKFVQNEQGIRVRLNRIGYTVLAELDDQIRIRQDGVEGWVRRDDFVPLELAVEFFSRVLDRDPADLHALNGRAEAHTLQGRYKDAVADYSKAIGRSPRDSYLYNNRARCWAMLNRPEKVLEDYSKAIELDPKDSSALTNRGQLYHQMDREKEALADLNAALGVEPRNPHALALRGFVQLALNDLDAALNDAGEAIRLDQKSPDAYRLRGIVYWRKDRWAEAIADARRAAGLTPDHAETLVLLSVLLAEAPDLKLRDVAEAMTLARRACVLTKHRNSLCLQTLAAACAANGDFAEAVRWQAKALDTPDGKFDLKIAEQHLELYKRQAKTR